MLNSLCHKILRTFHACIATGVVAFSANADAALLQINSALSQVTHTPGISFPVCYIDASGSLVCSQPAQPQTAALSGQIDLNVTHEHWEFGPYVTDRDLLNLNTINFSAGLLSSSFPLAGAVGLLNGNNFYVSDDPCFLSPFPGCSSTIWTTVHWGSEGTWDGRKLTWTGYSYENFGDSLTYTIVAEVVSASSAVPEPTTIALAGFGLTGLCWFRKRKAAKAA